MSGRFGELLLILLIVFVLFGAGKLPKVMSELGKGLRSFRKGINEKIHKSVKIYLL
jgi:sec-independent protein translocase protein TatA